MVIKVLSFPSEVLHSLDYKTGGSKLHIALKPHLFLSSPFYYLQPWKVRSQPPHKNHIYFSQSGSFGSLCILIPIALLLDSQKTSPAPNVSEWISKLIVHYLSWALNLAGLERLGCGLHTGNPLPTPIIYNILKKHVCSCLPTKMYSFIPLTLLKALLRP